MAIRFQVSDTYGKYYAIANNRPIGVAWRRAINSDSENLDWRWIYYEWESLKPQVLFGPSATYVSVVQWLVNNLERK